MWSSAFCSFFYPPVTSTHLGPASPVTAQFTNTNSLHPLMTEKVSNQYATGKVLDFFYFNIYVFRHRSGGKKYSELHRGRFPQIWPSLHLIVNAIMIYLS
jgi:hypothetical protein